MAYMPERDKKYITCPHIEVFDDDGRTPDTGVVSKDIILVENDSQVVTLLLCPMCHGLVRDAIHQETVQEIIKQGIKPFMGIR